MSYRHDTPENVATLVHLLGLEPATARAWLVMESQSVNNPTNPLNIRWYGAPALHPLTPGAAIGTSFGVYATPADGLADAARTIKTLRYYAGVRATLGKGDAIAQARAIEDSPWAGGHYGGGGTADGGIVRNTLAFLATTPVPPPLPQTHTLHIAAGVRVIHIASVTADKPPRIASWRTAPWSGNASSAPCGPVEELDGVFHGSAKVARVSGGVFVTNWVAVGDAVGTSVT